MEEHSRTCSYTNFTSLYVPKSQVFIFSYMANTLSLVVKAVIFDWGSQLRKLFFFFFFPVLDLYISFLLQTSTLVSPGFWLNPFLEDIPDSAWSSH